MYYEFPLESYSDIGGLYDQTKDITEARDAVNKPRTNFTNWLVTHLEISSAPSLCRAARVLFLVYLGQRSVGTRAARTSPQWLHCEGRR
jgi:hypothetical protein